MLCFATLHNAYTLCMESIIMYLKHAKSFLHASDMMQHIKSDFPKKDTYKIWYELHTFVHNLTSPLKTLCTQNHVEKKNISRKSLELNSRDLNVSFKIIALLFHTSLPQIVLQRDVNQISTTTSPLKHNLKHILVLIQPICSVLKAFWSVVDRILDQPFLILTIDYAQSQLTFSEW